MTENSDDDSEIEDFCLDYLFEEIVDLPEVLIDEQLNNSSDPELDSLLSSDTTIAQWWCIGCEIILINIAVKVNPVNQMGSTEKSAVSHNSKVL